MALGDRRLHLLHHLNRPRQRGVGQQQHKFFAAVAGRQIPRATHEGGQHLGHLTQAIVTRQVAVIIVVGFEAINIAKNEG